MSKGAEPFSGRFIEIIAVLVLGITTLGTAWCSYEAYQWNREEANLSQQATNEQLEASRLFVSPLRRSRTTPRCWDSMRWPIGPVTRG